LPNSGQSAILLKTQFDNQVINQFIKVSAMKSKNHNQQPGDDFNFQIRFKLSAKLKEFIITANNLGKVGITISKILIPLLLVGSSYLEQLAPQPSLPPESTQQNK
jgi:hypothetical protein